MVNVSMSVEEAIQRHENYITEIAKTLDAALHKIDELEKKIQSSKK